VLSATIKVYSQNLSDLKDSCYYYLENHDTVSFNRTYIKLYDEADKESDPEKYLIKRKLENIHKKDQGIRVLLMDARKKYGKDDKRTQSIDKIMISIDKQDAVYVKHIIDTYGWLSSDDIGEDANETLFLCIQHVNDLEVQTKYLPILKKAVEDGNAKGWQYAFLTDRILMNEGKKQIYGTQTLMRDKKKYYVVPLKYPAKVDMLRKEMGLGTLNEYMKSFGDGNKWSIDLYRKELPQIERAYQYWLLNK
jgi:hypothetical protein